MHIPLTEFAGFLKQIDSAHLAPEQRKALSVAVPHFWPAEPPLSEPEIKERARQQFGAVDEDCLEVILQKGPNRRFSGGEGLARQRYYTLSRDSIGNDNLTLLAEIRAYRACRGGGPICTILDAVYPPGRAVLEAQGLQNANSNTLLLVFLDNGSPTLARTVVAIPYAVSEARIDRVLDLRLLEAQKWFFTTFYLETGNASHYPIPDQPAVDFAGLLPFLATMELGGGGYTESIGRFLRRNHVEALIYPSARNDVCAYWESGELVDWSGWCLVDYRGAETPENILVDLAEQTPRSTRLLRIQTGTARGSWATQNVRQFYRYRYFVELQQTFGVDRSHPIITALLELEGGADEFWKFAGERSNAP